MATFEAYIPLLTVAEGGYQKNQNDNGNWTGGKKGVGNLVGTNHGISAPIYGQWIGRTPTEADMRAITKTVALEILKAWFWNKISASYIENQSVADILADHAVNAGPGAAAKLVQRVLNSIFGFNLTVDGGVGALTIEAINSVNANQLHEAIKNARSQFYLSTNDPDFLDGWLKRLKLFVFSEKKKP